MSVWASVSRVHAFGDFGHIIIGMTIYARPVGTRPDSVKNRVGFGFFFFFFNLEMGLGRVRVLAKTQLELRPNSTRPD